MAIISHLQSELSKIDVEIGSRYFHDNSGIPAERLYMADLWLYSDIEEALIRANDVPARRKEILEIIEKSDEAEQILKLVDLGRAQKSAEVRHDWPAALRGVIKVRQLSYTINYGFSEDDIAELARLHKAGRYRKKIEDLLTDCNFHTECGDFSCHKYEKYLEAEEKTAKAV